MKVSESDIKKAVYEYLQAQPDPTLVRTKSLRVFLEHRYGLPSGTFKDHDAGDYRRVMEESAAQFYVEYKRTDGQKPDDDARSAAESARVEDQGPDPTVKVNKGKRKREVAVNEVNDEESEKASDNHIPTSSHQESSNVALKPRAKGHRFSKTEKNILKQTMVDYTTEKGLSGIDQLCSYFKDDSRRGQRDKVHPELWQRLEELLPGLNKIVITMRTIVV